jgi:GNAT superfamily N-acetyltransferase
MLVQLSKTLQNPGVSSPDSPFRLRNYRGDDDIAVWLDIRQRALSGQIATGREWTEHDFRREFLTKPWWRPEWMWFAEEPDIGGACLTVGVGALRGTTSPGVASIQWLLVVPEHRRRGVGRQLAEAFESAAWSAGCRTIVAETLNEWEAAVRFYQSLGYRAGDWS